MKCKGCGSSLPDKAEGLRFCVYCGKHIGRIPTWVKATSPLATLGVVVALAIVFWPHSSPRSMPDLVVDNLTCSVADLSVGQDATITVRIRNEGGVAAGPSTTRCYLDDVTLSSASVESLPGNEVAVQDFIWEVQPGDHVVKVAADYANQVAESDEGNNQKEMTITGPPPPDLVIDNMTWTPVNPCEGEVVTFTVTVKNQGTGSAGQFNVRCGEGSSASFADYVDFLGAGSTVVRTFEWTAPAGSSTVVVVADGGNLVPESDESNNTKQAAFDVLSSGTLVVHASPADATVSVYSLDQLRSTGSATVRLPDGTYTVKLTKPGYKDWGKQVTIVTGQTTTVYAYMEPGAGIAATRSETITPESAGFYGTLEVHTAGDVNTYVGGEYGGITDHWNGTATVNGLLPGTYTLKLSISGCKDWTKEVTVVAVQKTTVYAYLEPGAGTAGTRSETITPESAGVYGTLEVHTSGDVNTYVAGEYGGITDHWNGTATTSGLLPGTYTLKLSISGCKDWTKQVTIVSGQNTTLYAYMEPGAGTSTTRSETITPESAGLYGTLEVHTSGDVNTYIADEYGGIADHWNGTATVSGLLPGTYTLRLSISGCKDWTKQVTIVSGQKTTVYAYMEPGAGSATMRGETITPESAGLYGTLEVHTAGDVNISVDGEYGGITDHWNGTATVSGLLPGTYTLRLSISGCKDWTKQVTIVSGQKTTVYAYMEPGAGTATTRSETITPESAGLYGSLEVHTAGDVNIYVDGEYGGITDHWNGTATVSGLLPGTYTLRLTKAGYDDWTAQVTITAGAITVIEATLVPA